MQQLEKMIAEEETIIKIAKDNVATAYSAGNTYELDRWSAIEREKSIRLKALYDLKNRLQPIAKVTPEIDSRTHKTTVVCPYCETTNEIMVNSLEFVDSSSMYVCENECCKENFFIEFKVIGINRSTYALQTNQNHC